MVSQWSIRPRAALLVVLAALLGGLIGGLLVKLADMGSDSPAGHAACVSTAVAERVLPSVVTVQVAGGAGGGNGTGELIRADGSILTNDHVVAAATNGSELSVRYLDGSTSPATIVGRDPLTDLAVIRASDGAGGFPVIAIGSSTSLQVGQPVVALGAPLGLYSTVTAGIVSALDRYVPVPAANGRTHHLVDAIQTDASINPGNSGGPLVNCAGQLVGINSAIITVPNSAGESSAGSVGLGFAIPVDLAVPLADQLIETGRVAHPTFGVEAVPLPPTKGSAGSLLLTDVTVDGPAYAAGLRPADVITAVDESPATRVAALERAIVTRSAGDTVEVTYTRNGEPATTTVTLGS